MFVFILLTLLSATVPALAQFSESDSCQTPDNLNGTCILLQNCPSIYSLIQKRPVPPETMAFLRRSQCGFDSSTPKVCCPTSTLAKPSSQNPPRFFDPLQNDLIPGKDICGNFILNKLLGGEQTLADEFPWSALLEYTKPYGKAFHCGGALIASKYVLTAAHCINGEGILTNWRLTSVRLGEYNIKTDQDFILGVWAPAPVDIPIESTVVHHEYVPSSKAQHNDIALLRLARPAQFTDFIKPVCLPFNENIKTKLFEHDLLYVVGWGETETTSYSDEKLQGSVRVASKLNCTAIYQKFGVTIGNKQICAGGERGKNACKSDSGGPLVVMDHSNNQSNWYVIGVMSFGPSHCDILGWPAVYTKVSDYADWISNNILP